jgi:hypothetical protein
LRLAGLVDLAFLLPEEHLAQEVGVHAADGVVVVGEADVR